MKTKDKKILQQDFTSGVTGGSLSSSKTNGKQNVPAVPYILLGVIALIIGGMAALSILVKGHEASTPANYSVLWGLMIAAYAFFATTTAGLAFIGGLGHAFGYKAFGKLSKRIVALAFVVLLAAFTQIGLDLGNPLKLGIYIFVSPNFSSPITWMGLLYSIELLLLGTELYLMFRPNQTKANQQNIAIVGFLAMIVGVAAATILGLLFGVLNSVPFFQVALSYYE